MIKAKSISEINTVEHEKSIKGELLLFACGAAILFWELLLIRWMGSCIRIVAYFSNFILIATFLGLGAGALLARYKFSLEKLLFPICCLCLMLGPILGAFSHDNPNSTSEYIWQWGVSGVGTPDYSENLRDWVPTGKASYWILLATSFISVIGVFLVLGQMLGIFFKKTSPLKAYFLEIGGSVLGIALFGILSFNNFPPSLWFLTGFILLFMIVQPNVKIYLISAILCVFTLLAGSKFEQNYIWSPYYKIQLLKMNEYRDNSTGKIVNLDDKFGYHVSVNNDYHQLIINLANRDNEEEFFKSWRWLYEYPYRTDNNSVEGPILIVGAGTGNDVSAALRKTHSQIDVVEIDPQIIRVGKLFHPEEPYSNRRVTIINDDARHYFAITKKNTPKSYLVF